MIEQYVDNIKMYLPLEEVQEEVQEYIHYISNACIFNANDEKYQFSFLAFHMLYMCFIYKIIWQANKCGLSTMRTHVGRCVVSVLI